MTRTNRLTAYLLLTSLLSISCSGMKGRLFGSSSGPNTRASVLTGGLQWFGFYPGSLAASNSIPEVQGFTNFVMSQLAGDNIAPAARAAGLKAILTAPAADDPEWDAWADRLQPNINDVLTFFIMDEPDCVSGGNPDRLRELLGQVEASARRVKNRFPGATTMLTAGCIAGIGRNNPHYRIPNEIDILALEVYHTRESTLEYMSIAKTYLGNRKMFLMPLSGYNGNGEAEVIQRLGEVYEIAKTDSQVIGIFPFAWYSAEYNCAAAGVFCGNGIPSGNYSIPVIGQPSVRDSPTMRARFAQVGREISGRALPPPSPSPTPTPTPTPAPVPTPTPPPPNPAGSGIEGYVQLSSAAAILNLRGQISNGTYGLGYARGWAAFRDGVFVHNIAAILPTDIQYATPDVAAALEAAVR